MSYFPAVMTNINIRNLFATPLIVGELPAAIAVLVNPQIKELVLRMEKEMPSAVASNLGGWQSDDKLPVWGGDGVKSVLSALYEMVEHVTLRLDPDGSKRGGVPWKINGWANINRNGASNAAHIHPGAYWSAVYYVECDPDDAHGGAFQAFDPRGGLPLMYCPLLRMGMEGHLHAGHAETHQPRAGQCLIFPSWLSHAVTPYTGDALRISLAFNFSL